MEDIDELPEVECKRNALLGGVYATLLAGELDHPGVIGLAAADCWELLRAPRWATRSEVVTMHALSAARFFLSEEGQAMICAAGLGREGIRWGVRLANAVLARLRVPVQSLMDIPHGQFAKAMDHQVPRFSMIPAIATLFSLRQEQFFFDSAAA